MKSPKKFMSACLFSLTDRNFFQSGIFLPSSAQEEADTRMILQALHADKKLKELGKQGRIIIKTSDTDVIVLCIYFDKQMTNTSELVRKIKDFLV
jgi:hypothetical protein